MKIHMLQVAPLGTNCYILCGEEARLCAVVDPGGDADRVAAAVKDTGCTPVFILLTHGHYDHTGGVAELCAALPSVSVYIHRADFSNPDARLFPLKGQMDAAGQLSAVHFYGEGDRLTLGGLDIQVLHTPGHSKGSVTLRCGNTLFCGDTLFAGSCGRTDFADGSMTEMMASLKRLGNLEGNLLVLPGHMGHSDLDGERARNPYLIQAMGSLFTDTAETL